MSEKKREETAGPEEEHRPRSEKMTEQKKKQSIDLADAAAYALTFIGSKIKKDNPAYHTHWQIACILRRAAGLTCSDTPASAWLEEGTPEIVSFVAAIINSANGPGLDDPKSASDDLHALRYSLRDLKQKFLAINKLVMSRINDNADPGAREWRIKYHLEYLVREKIEFQESLDFQHHQTPIEVALEQMDRLEDGINGTLEEVEHYARGRADMGQSRTYAAKQVALGVAEYMYKVNHKIPGLWTGENPSGTYAKAVLEIFDLLDIPRGSLQRAGEYAIAKLRAGEFDTAIFKRNPIF